MYNKCTYHVVFSLSCINVMLSYACVCCPNIFFFKSIRVYGLFDATLFSISKFNRILIMSSCKRMDGIYYTKFMSVYLKTHVSIIIISTNIHYFHCLFPFCTKSISQAHLRFSCLLLMYVYLLPYLYSHHF